MLPEIDQRKETAGIFVALHAMSIDRAIFLMRTFRNTVYSISTYLKTGRAPNSNFFHG